MKKVVMRTDQLRHCIEEDLQIQQKHHDQVMFIARENKVQLKKIIIKVVFIRVNYIRIVVNSKFLQIKFDSFMVSIFKE